VRIRPDSLPFTLLLGLLSSLPTFGIDMILTTLSATGADLGAPPSDVGLAMRSICSASAQRCLCGDRCRIGSAASRLSYLAAQF
jgi:hypothetical protein